MENDTIDIGRMNVLPRFLFLFQMLPFVIDSATFKHWDTILTRFLWNNKKVRVKLKTLKLPKEDGGLALPDLRNYYLAAQIQTIRTWMQEDSTVKRRPI